MRATLRELVSAPEDAVGTILLAAISVVTIAAVVFRYVLNDSLLWSEEVGRLGLIAMTFMGIGTGFRRGTHVAIDLSSWFPDRVNVILRSASLLVSCAFLLFLLWQAWGISQMLQFSFTAALGVPLPWVYVVIAVATAWGLVRALVLLVGSLRGAGR